MISIFYGDDYESFFDRIFQDFKNDKKQEAFLIVPDQFSFYTEKKVYFNYFKKRKNFSLRVFTFNKICVELFKKYGFIAGDFAQKSTKILILSLVILNLQKELKIPKNLIYNHNFSSIILKTIENLKKNNISPHILKEKIEKIKNKNLAKKTNNLLKIYNRYEKELKKKFKDPLENLEKARKISKKENFFKNIKIYFLFFEEFSAPQLNFIDTISKQTNLCFFIRFKKRQLIFKIHQKTIKILKSIAIKNKIKFKNPIYLKRITKKSQELTILEKNIFNQKKINKIKINTPENIKIIAASNIEVEVENALAKIIEFVQKGYKWHEIAILSRNLDAYETYLELNLKNFNIPYFFNQTSTANKMTILKIATNILEISLNFDINLYLNILKLGLTKFETFEIATYENIIKTISFEKNILKTNFKNIYKTLYENNSYDKYKKLVTIFEKIQNPLNMIFLTLNFKKDYSKNISLKLLKIFEILGIKEKIETKIKDKNKLEDIKTGWDILIKTIEQIFKLTQNFKISLKQFKFLFQSAIKNEKIKNIPKILNCVFVGEIQKTIPINTKITVILGANSEFFPYKHKQSGEFFKNEEIVDLKKAGLNFLKTITEKNLLETFFCYNALVSSYKYLLIYYSESNENFKQNQTTEKIKSLFKHNIHSKINETNFFSTCLTKKIAFKKLLQHYNEKTKETLLLKKCFAFKIKNINNLTKTQKKIPRFNKLSYINFSPTQIEQFFKCPFSYFCKYLLEIEPITTTSSMLIGKITHKILEDVVSLKNFKYLDEKDIEKKVAELLDKYIKTNIFKEELNIKKFEQNNPNFKKEISKLCSYIKNELVAIDFSPTFFEYPISQNSKIKPLKIKIDDKTSILISGIIDRIDIGFFDNNKFIRIIDYKYKGKNFNFTDLYNGLNLQMMIYLMVVSKAIKNLKDVILSGFLYMPTIGALKNYANFKNSPKKDTIEKIKNKLFLPNGLVINSCENKNILEKIKNSSYNKFSPLKTTKNGIFYKKYAEKFLVEQDELEKIFKFIEEKIKNMCIQIKNLNFEKKPAILPENKTIFCSFCSFKEICKKEEILKPTKPQNLNKLEFFNILNKTT